jgi:hypothetical protein
MERFCGGRKMDDGRVASTIEIVQAEKIDRGYVGSFLQPPLLAPRLFRAGNRRIWVCRR